MLFQKIKSYNTPVTFCCFSRSPNSINIVALTEFKKILVFNVKSPEPHYEMQLTQQPTHISAYDSLLMISTRVKTVIVDILAQKCVYQTEPGTIYALNLKQFVLLNENCLFLIKRQANTGELGQLSYEMRQIRQFQHKIQDSCLSDSYNSRILALTSNLTYVWHHNNLLQMQFALRKILHCDEEYVCGMVADKFVVRSILADITVYQVTQQAIMAKMKGNRLYLVSKSQMKIYEIWESRIIGIVKMVETIDILLTEECLYGLTADLDLYGVKVSSSPTKYESPIKQIPQNSIIQQNLEQTHINHDSQDFILRGIIQNFKEEHDKFLSRIVHRDNCIKGIHKWWHQNNIRAALSAIQFHEDLGVINDCVSFMKKTLTKIPKQQLTTLIKSCSKLIGSKYPTHVETGLSCMNNVMKYIGQDKKINELSDEIKKIKQMPRLQKILLAKITPQRKYMYEQALILEHSINKYL